jgi:hypothetical protein
MNGARVAGVIPVLEALVGALLAAFLAVQKYDSSQVRAAGRCPGSCSARGRSLAKRSRK